MAPPPVKVLIVEDSPVMQRLLAHVIEGDPRLSVVGGAYDAEQAMQLLHDTRPDVVSMDIRLPRINGLELTRTIMRQHPVPIVVVAADIDDGTLAISMNALKAGALTVVEKPKGAAEADWRNLSHHLCTQLYIMSQVKVVRQRPTNLPAPSPLPGCRRAFGLVGIGASTGGPGALVTVLGALSPAFPLPIVVVQHIGAPFVEGFAHWLSTTLPLAVTVAAEGQALLPGQVYIAPGGRHLLVKAGRLILDDGPPVCGQKPAVDRLFQSMAGSYGASSIGALLTGMGEDGARGLLALREAGAHTIAEDESSAVVWGMPGVAVRLNAVEEQLPASMIGQRLLSLTLPQNWEEES